LPVQPLPRPPAVNAAVAVAAVLALLTVVSWVLHWEFSRRFGQPGPGSHSRIEGVSVATLNRIGESGKALALLGAGAVLVLRVRRCRYAARVAVVIGMAGAAAAHGLAALYDGASVVLGFLFAALASAANALSGGRGLPGGGTLGIGVAAIATDLVSLALALTCVALLLGPSARRYLAS
jgi:hypothetical protein